MPDVGAIGGSIAGCFSALDLLNAAHRVTVFERSEAELHRLLGAGWGRRRRCSRRSSSATWSTMTFRTGFTF